jgi:ribose transport system substrate-binding protein
MSTTRWMSTTMATGALVVALAACGSSSSSSSSSAAAGGGTSTSAGTSSAAPASVPFSSIEQKAAASYPTPKPKHLRLAYLNPEGGNEFLGTLGNSMKLSAKKLGGTYTELDAGGDVNKQVSQFDQLIAQKVDGIAVFALDPKSLAPDVARAKKAGIHLVTIDLNFASTSASSLGGYESQVWQRRDEAAYDTGKEMAKLLAKGSSLGTIDLIVKVPSIVFSIVRDGYWAKKFGLSVAGNASNPSDDIAGGEKAMTQLLGQHSSIKGVMAYNDPSAIGAASAALSQGQSGLKFGGENGGSDALGAIKAGRETFSLKLDAPSMGKDWTYALYDLSEGVKVPGTVKAGAPVVVDKSNVGSTISWEQQLKQEYPGS